MKTKRKVILVAICVLLALIIVIIYFNVIFVIGERSYVAQIGIIDSVVSEDYKASAEIIFGGDTDIISTKKSHGDELLNFLEYMGYNGKIYYYIATGTDQKIDTDSLLAGLNWLNSKGLKRISISLSSHYYDKRVQKWIAKHDNIQVYASYNNLKNSKDYPAMYDGVVGIGAKDTVVSRKGIDKIYRANTMIVFPFGKAKKGLYKGNSYLTLFTVIYK